MAPLSTRCAALNPDPDAEGSEGEEGEEGMEPGDGVLFTSADSLSSMSLAQVYYYYTRLLNHSTNIPSN